MSNVVSRDGTIIAFEARGRGPAVILVDGALCHRRLGPSKELAALLAERFTVYTYDRRGRGESGDTAPYAVEREVDDLAAILHAAGGEAFVWATSSGAVLALEAAKRLTGIRKLALYEAPCIVDDSRPTTEEDWRTIRDAVQAGRRSDAVKAFLKSVGMPWPLRLVMPYFPIWPQLSAVAPTLVYDGALVQDEQRGKPLTGRWSSVKAPTLVMDGGKSPAWMHNGNRALAAALPNARYLTLDRENHMMKAKAHAPALTKFFEEAMHQCCAQA